MVGFDPLANTGLGLRKKPIVGGQKSDIGKFSPDPQFASVATEQPKASFVAPAKPTTPTPASNSMITKVDMPQAPLTTPQMQSTTVAPTAPVQQPKSATFARPADAQNQAKDTTINLFLSQFANDIKAGMPREVIPQYYPELPVEVLADLYEDVKMGSKIEQLKPLYPELQNLNPLENIPVAMTTDDINPFSYIQKGADYVTEKAEDINIPLVEPVAQGFSSAVSFASKGIKDVTTALNSIEDKTIGEGNLYNRSNAEDAFDLVQGGINTAFAYYTPAMSIAFNSAIQGLPVKQQQQLGEVFNKGGEYITMIPGFKELKASLPPDRQKELEQELFGAFVGLILGTKGKANIIKNPIKFIKENGSLKAIMRNAQENVLNIPVRKGVKAIQGSTPIMQEGIKQAGKVIEGAKQMAGDMKEGAVGMVDKTTDYIAKKATQTVSDEDKLFKASSPRFNVLSRNKDIKSMKENSRIADEAVVNEGYKPTDTESRVQAHKNTMEAQWKRIEAKIQNKEDYMADLTPVIDDLEKYIAEVEKSGIAKNEGDINQLKREVKRMKAEPRVDIPTLESKKQFINGVINNRGDSKIGDVYKNGMKKATARIGDIMDEVISTLPGELKNDKRIFGALKATYEDIIKANIKAQRKKGDGIVETFSRIEGFADIIGGGVNLFSQGSKGFGQIVQGAGKVILGKSLAKATDPDFLITEGFKGLSQKKGKNIETGVKVGGSKGEAKYKTYTKSGLEQSKKKLDNRMLALPEKTTNNIGTPKNPIKAGYTPAKPTNKGLQVKSKQETATILSSKEFDKKGMTKIPAVGYGDQAPKVGDFTSKGKIVETTHSGGGAPQRRVKVQGDTNWTKASDIEIYRKQGLETKETPKLAQKQGGMVEKTAKVESKGLETKKGTTDEVMPRDMPQEAMPIKNRLQEIKNAKGWTPRKEMLNSIQSEYGFKIDDLSIEDTDKLAKALNGNTSADKAMEIIEEIGGKYGKKFMKDTSKKDLYTEAKKYKSAEEFENASKQYIHVTTKDVVDDIRNKGFKGSIGNKSSGMTDEKGVWFYENFDDVKVFRKAKQFWKGDSNISELTPGYINGKIYDLGGEDILKALKDKDLISKLKKEGYVGLAGRENIFTKGTGPDSIKNTRATIVFDENNVLNRNQLRKIRDEANTKFKKETSKPQQGLSEAEISKTVAKYFKPDEISVIFREKITTPDGSNAFGAYHNKMIEFAKNPMKGTPEHEVVHAYIDLFKTNQQKLDILDHVLETRKLEVGATKKKYGITDDYLGAEEFLADGFIKYAQGKATFTGKIKTYFQDLWNDIKGVFGKEDKVRRLYQDITGKKRPKGLEPKNTGIVYKKMGKNIDGKNIVAKIQGMDFVDYDKYGYKLQKDNKTVGQIEFDANWDEKSGLGKKWLKDYPYYSAIRTITIDPKLQGKGIATEMYKYILNNLPEGKKGIVGIKEMIRNPKVDAIYKKLGATIDSNGNYILEPKNTTKKFMQDDQLFVIPKDVVEGLKKEKGLSADDIMKKYPDLNLKREIVIKDVHGKKSVIEKGEALTPYEVKGNKIVLQDGETYVVSKSTFEQVKNNAIQDISKDFAPELKGTEETIMGNRQKYHTNMDKNSEGKWDLIGDDDKKVYGSYDTLKELKVAEDKLLNKDNIKDTKYKQYQLPGGENYREILIKAPGEKIQEPLKWVEQNSERYTAKIDGREITIEKEKGGWYVFEKDSILGSFANSLNEAMTTAQNYISGEYKGKSFKSSHRDEPNVISHLRMNERTYNGKKVMFMEELQSDWAREGRSKGFAFEGDTESLLPDGWTVDYNGANYIVKDADGNNVPNKLAPGAGGAWAGNKDQAIGMALGRKDVMPFGSIPNNPLLKNRQEPTIKRALQEAVKNGSEYFAWINGEQTAGRYNLSKQVDDIERFLPDTAKSGLRKTIVLNPKGSSNRIEFEISNDGIIKKVETGTPIEWRGKKIDEVIGKGLAEKIIGKDEGKLQGEGLNIGGERAYNLYDKQVANIVEKLTGKKAEMIDLGIAKEGVKMYSENIKNKQFDIPLSADNAKKGIDIVIDNQKYIISGKFGNSISVVPLEEVEHYIQAKGMNRERAIGQAVYNGYAEKFDIPEVANNKQQAIKLTPEVKALIEGKSPLAKKPSGRGLPMRDTTKGLPERKFIKDTTTDLYTEARKYKSAEEFVKANIDSKEYRSSHQLSLSESMDATEIDVAMLKEDIRKRNGYLNNYSISDLRKLEKMQKTPDAEITIYRASPINELNDGDWVTTDKVYANDIKRMNGGKVYSYQAKLSDLRFPKDTDSLPSASMASTFSYSPKTSQLRKIREEANKGLKPKSK